MIPTIDLQDEMNTSSYAEAVSFLWRIAYKFNLIVLLGSTIDGVVSTPPKFAKISGFPPEEREHLAALISMQVVALSYELTENFAAMSSAYRKARTSGGQYFPVVLRDFTGAQRFYERCLDSEEEAASALGLDSRYDRSEVVKFQEMVGAVVKFRTKYYRWYNLHKHVAGAIPSWIDLPNGIGRRYILFKIPDTLGESETVFGGEPSLRGAGDFREILKMEPMAGEVVMFPTLCANEAGPLAERLQKVGMQIRKRQHKALFGKDPENDY